MRWLDWLWDTYIGDWRDEKWMDGQSSIMALVVACLLAGHVSLLHRLCVCSMVPSNLSLGRISDAAVFAYSGILLNAFPTLFAVQ